MFDSFLSKINFLFYFILFIINNKHIKIRDFKNIIRAGSGLSNTLIINKKFVVKIKNSFREKESIKLYHGKYDNKIDFAVQNKFKYEFDMLNKLHKLGMSPLPLEFSSYYISMKYIDVVPINEKLLINPELIREIVSKINLLHKHNIYHTDLNLGNILIDSSNHIYFIDFEYKFNKSLKDDEKEILDYIIFMYKIFRFHCDIWKKYKKEILKDINNYTSKIDKYIIEHNDYFSLEFVNEFE